MSNEPIEPRPHVIVSGAELELRFFFWTPDGMRTNASPEHLQCWHGERYVLVRDLEELLARIQEREP